MPGQGARCGGPVTGALSIFRKGGCRFSERRCDKIESGAFFDRTPCDGPVNLPKCAPGSRLVARRRGAAMTSGRGAARAGVIVLDTNVESAHLHVSGARCSAPSIRLIPPVSIPKLPSGGQDG